MTLAAPAADPSDVLRLLDAAKNGGAAASAVVARHMELVTRVVGCRLDRLLRARLDPADVVQEVGLRITARLPDYLARRPMPFHLWVRKTTADTLIDLRRKHLGAECRVPGTNCPSRIGRRPCW